MTDISCIRLNFTKVWLCITLNGNAPQVTSDNIVGYKSLCSTTKCNPGTSVVRVIFQIVINYMIMSDIGTYCTLNIYSIPVVYYCIIIHNSRHFTSCEGSQANSTGLVIISINNVTPDNNVICAIACTKINLRSVTIFSVIMVQMVILNYR